LKVGLYAGMHCYTLLSFVVRCTKQFCLQSNSEYAGSLAYLLLSDSKFEILVTQCTAVSIVEDTREDYQNCSVSCSVSHNYMH